MEFTQETINQYGFLGAFFGAILTVLAYKGVPALIDYFKERGKISLQAEAMENETQQVENKKDLATVQLAQVIVDENAEMRETKRLQAAQIIEQANEISRLKNYEFAVEELRSQRHMLLDWILDQSGRSLDKDTLIRQLRNEVLILETMIKTEYKDNNDGNN